MIRFGPAGNSKRFYDEGYKTTLQMPEWLGKLGLNAYEYQGGRGINIKEEKATNLGREARKYNIALSIHAPYYINLSSVEEQKRINSKRYIIDSMQAAKFMGAKRVVVHPGSCSKVSREWALETAIKVLKETIEEADDKGLSNISICPEVMGKINQLGTLEEIIEMCKIDERLIPTIDFGHLNARNHGSLKEKADFDNVAEKIENSLGYERLKRIHCHFSRIEFTEGGEKKHWTLDDTQYGPDFEPLSKTLAERKMEPIIICESMDNMADDAKKLKNIYEETVRNYEKNNSN